MAIYDYLKEHPTVKQDIINILKEDPKIYFRNALPSNIVINVVVISELNNILAVKRSSAVANAKNEWTVGPFETMIYNFNAPAESDSSFDSLARRCLKEELGIEANDYKEIFISWVGLSLLSMRLHVVAIVKIQSTTEANIERKMRKAHGYYEASMVQWLPLDEVQIKNFIENNSGVYMDSINQQEGKWSPFTSLALTEALRVKDYDLFPNVSST
jgi:hypothetical protein